MWTGSLVGSETNGFKKGLHQTMQDAWGVVEEMTSAGAGLMVFGGVTTEWTQEKDKQSLGQTEKQGLKNAFFVRNSTPPLLFGTCSGD